MRRHAMPLSMQERLQLPVVALTPDLYVQLQLQFFRVPGVERVKLSITQINNVRHRNVSFPTAAVCHCRSSEPWSCSFAANHNLSYRYGRDTRNKLRIQVIDTHGTFPLFEGVEKDCRFYTQENTGAELLHMWEQRFFFFSTSSNSLNVRRPRIYPNA